MPGPTIGQRRRAALPGTVDGQRLPEARSLSLRLSPAHKDPRRPHWSAGYSRTKPASRSYRACWCREFYIRSRPDTSPERRRVAGTACHKPRQIRLTHNHLRRRTPIRPFCFTGHSLLTGPCETFAANTDAVAHRLRVAQNEIKECVSGIDDHGARRLVAGVVNHLPNKCSGTVSSFWWFDQRRRGRNRSRS